MDIISMKVSQKVTMKSAKKLCSLINLKTKDIVSRSTSGSLTHEFSIEAENPPGDMQNELTNYEKAKIEFYVIVAEYEFLNIPYQVMINNEIIEMDIDDVRLWVMNKEKELAEISSYITEMKELNKTW